VYKEVNWTRSAVVFDSAWHAHRPSVSRYGLPLPFIPTMPCFIPTILCFRMTSTLVMASLLLAWGCSDVVRSSPELRDTDQVSSPVVFQRCTFCLKLSTADWPLTRARDQLLTSSHVSSQHFHNLTEIHFNRILPSTRSS
jgi:hypothetical protein